MSNLKKVKPGDWLKHDKTKGLALVEGVTNEGKYIIAYRGIDKYRIRVEDGFDIGWGHRFSIGGFWTPEDVEEN